MAKKQAKKQWFTSYRDPYRYKVYPSSAQGLLVMFGYILLMVLGLLWLLFNQHWLFGISYAVVLTVGYLWILHAKTQQR